MIETSYKDHTIRLNEETEIWICDGLNVENAKLSAVKRRIDAIGKSERKVNVKALMPFREYRDDEAKIDEVLVTVLCDPEPRDGYRGKAGETLYCWIKNGKDRSKVKIDQLISHEHHSAAKAWVRLDAEARLATDAASAALEAIPRHDADSLLLLSKEEAAA